MSFLSGKKASEKLGVHYRTLYNWEKKGKIEVMRSPGGKRFYNVEKYLQDNNKEEEIKLKKNICYIRVSTHNQKSDLENQRKEMKNLYPDYELIEDIGSGINFNRLGFRKIIKYAINGEINKVVVLYKDRLCRFGYNFIEDLIKEYSNGIIEIVHSVKEKEPQEELVMDVLQVMNVFVAKMNGLRKYKI